MSDTTLKDKLQSAMKEAMKAHEKVRLETIRGMLSAIQYERMQKNVEALADADCVTVLQREVKKRRESLDFAEKAGRQELADRAREEIAVIEKFLPQQMSSNELETILTAMKKENAALNMGMAMKLLKEKYSGKYDSKMASEIAKRLLG